MDANIITVNNFFGHWIKDIDIRQYPDNTRILPTNNYVDVYQYSASQLKYLPKNAKSTIEKTLFYSKKPVYFDVDVDRRSNNYSSIELVLPIQFTIKQNVLMII